MLKVRKEEIHQHQPELSTEPYPKNEVVTHLWVVSAVTCMLTVNETKWIRIFQMHLIWNLFQTYFPCRCHYYIKVFRSNSTIANANATPNKYKLAIFCHPVYFEMVVTRMIQAKDLDRKLHSSHSFLNHFLLNLFLIFD